MKTLGNALRKIGMGGLGISLAGLLSLGSESCTPAQQKVVAGDVIMEEAKTPEQLMAGYLLKTIGTMEHDIEVAEAGKDEININIERAIPGERSTRYENLIYRGNNQYSPAKGHKGVTSDARDVDVWPIKKRVDEYDFGQRVIGKWIALPLNFTCKGFKDYNGDGYIGKDELIGLKNYFPCKALGDTTRVLCGSSWTNVKGKKIIGKLSKTNTGEILMIDNNDDGMWLEGRARWMRANFYKGKDIHGIKSYTVEWFVDGRLIPTRTINFFVDYGEKIENENQE